MTSLDALTIKIYADGADKAGMLKMYRTAYIRGFTTNPTLMRKANVADYEGFAKEILGLIPDRPISFEVFSDDFAEMEWQARRIAEWGDNVYIKIPVTNSYRQPATALIHRLAAMGIKLNITAVFTLQQVEEVSAAIGGRVPAVVSVFAGRIADTGVDPVPLMTAAKAIVRRYEGTELLWASPREVLNIVQADEIGCDIITVTHDILAKLDQLGKDLGQFSLETVRMFRDDAVKAGFSIGQRPAAAA
jgi:transaldolase